MKLSTFVLLLALPTTWTLVHHEVNTKENMDDSWLKYIAAHQSHSISSDVHVIHIREIVTWVYIVTKLGMSTPPYFVCRLCRPADTINFPKIKRNQDGPKTSRHALAGKHDQVMERLRGKIGTDD